jgi:hypothetical protein
MRLNSWLNDMILIISMLTKESATPRECFKCLAETLEDLYNAAEELVDAKIASKKQMLKAEFGVSDWENIVVKKFWLMTLQCKLYSEVEIMANDRWEQKESRTDNRLYNAKLLDKDTDRRVVNEDLDRSAFSFKSVFEFFVRYFVAAKLSDPPCYVYPKPNSKQTWPSESIATLVDGTKRRQHVTAQDTVVVLFPGLYFTDPGVNGAVTAAKWTVKYFSSDEE